MGVRMKEKVNGWVLHKRGTGRTERGYTFLMMMWPGTGKITPYFSSLQKLQAFGDVLQDCRKDMSQYEALYAEGLTDDNDLLFDPDISDLRNAIMSGIAMQN